MPQGRLLFLSRLCGGEDFGFDFFHFTSFLSRLCGGEDDALRYPNYLSFLSRLCGGEVTYFLK